MAKQYSTINSVPESSGTDSIEGGGAAILDQDTSYKGSQDSLESSSASTSFKEVKGSPSESPLANKWTWSFVSSAASSEKRASIGTTLRSSTLFGRSFWTSEILSLSLGIGALAGIIAVLAYFNGQALPNWPYDVTINTLIALLATIVNAGVSVSLQSGLSQLKWIKFKSDRAPLVDFETFDEASRGSRGAIKLLASGRGG